MPVFFPTNGVEAVELNFTILKGEGLAAKDRNMMGKRTTSDPYIVITLETTTPPVGRQKAKTTTKELGKTKTIMKTVDPEWKEAFNVSVPCSALQDPKTPPKLKLHIWDYDAHSDDDSMGVVTIPILVDPPKNSSTKEWYKVPADSAKNAKGKLQIKMDMEITRSTTLKRGNAFPLETNRIRLGLAWDLVKGKVVDLDAACVAVDVKGRIDMDNSVYYGNLKNENESMKHSGDSKDGAKEGEDEAISLKLDKIPSKVLALYLILTVASTKRYLSSVASARVTIVDESKKKKSDQPMASFAPSKHIDSEDATALFLVRIARSSKKDWKVQPIEDINNAARDFGSLIPNIKSYTKDLLPDIKVDPYEKVSIMRKGGAIKIKDFCPQGVPDKVTFGLSWDMTTTDKGDKKKIDLDASAICLDTDLKCVDKIWFKHLNSEDGAIRHGGDQRSGDEQGDDELVFVELPKIARRIHYIGFIVNSYSGQELDDVQKASCHLFDTLTGVDIAVHALSNCAILDGHTALVMGVLYRVKGKSKKESEWCLKIISQAAQGKTVKDNVDELQKYLEENPVFTPKADGNEDDPVPTKFAKMPKEKPIED